MKYEIKHKLNFKNVDMDIEIVSRKPGSQGVRITDTNNFYQVLINGHATYISEPILDLFQDLNDKKLKESKKVSLEEVDKPSEVVNMPCKKGKKRKKGKK